MYLRPVVLAFIAVHALVLQAFAAVYTPPSTNDFSGKTASGILWSTVATGTSLPIRTSATNTLNGSPGAVVYYNTVTGQLQVDPKGYDLNSVIITYTAGSNNVSSTNSGPFTYATGTNADSYSPSTGTPKTFPAKNPTTSGLSPTTFSARVGITIGAPLSASLTPTGDSGNIASTGTSGFWNMGWNFPSDLVSSAWLSSMNFTNFKTIGQNNNANANILGYGKGVSTFQYGISGVIGTQVGAVIPLYPVLTVAFNLISSAPTNGYRAGVFFTATNFPVDAASNVVFSANGVPFSTNDVVNGGAASIALTNLPRGATNIILAIYSGGIAPPYPRATNTLTQTVTNHPPVAADATYYRAKGLSLKIDLANLFTNVTDADGDSIALQSVGSGTNGATITTNSVKILYAPGTGAGSNFNDSFTYTAKDGFGGNATANILVNVYSAAGLAVMGLPSNGAVNIQFFGIPTFSYVVETTTNLGAAWWPLSTNTAGSDGSWQFTDPNATNNQQYYRSTQP
jgi:hypothetical protein